MLDSVIAIIGFEIYEARDKNF